VIDRSRRVPGAVRAMTNQKLAQYLTAKRAEIQKIAEEIESTAVRAQRVGNLNGAMLQDVAFGLYRETLKQKELVEIFGGE
jgi:hypothetical protein